ncbi:hypothetical protein [Formicincola oecophyllae]|uniref:hypothetical protein n=1 Tax=Formicincola oecophyllae TaxID=2558361 RepID=UPI00143D86AE|nr:hypothetical protein [Formicincola oecophyllae]
MNTTLTAPAYSFVQFADDPSINAFMTATNQTAQGGLDWLLQHPLALWTAPQMKGGLLAYSLYCLYGQGRPNTNFTILKTSSGAINDTDVNRMEIDGQNMDTVTVSPLEADDILKRVATWNFFKGDGFNFTIPWLKRRVMRFLTGSGGASGRFNNTVPVSVQVAGRGVTITVASGPWDGDVIAALTGLLEAGHLHLPTMYNFTLKGVLKRPTP